MVIKLVCGCGAKFSAREQLAGKEVECAACGKEVHVPFPRSGGAGAGTGLTVLITVLTAGVVASGAALFFQHQRITSLGQELGLNKTVDVAETARLDKDVELAKKDLEDAEKDLTRHADDLKSLNDEKFKLITRITLAEQQLTTFETMKADKADITKLQNDISSDERRLTDLEAKRVDLDQKVTAATTKAEAARALADGFETRVKALETDTTVSSLTTQLIEIKAGTGDAVVTPLWQKVEDLSRRGAPVGDAYQVLAASNRLLVMDTRTGDVLIHEAAARRGRGGFVPLDQDEFVRRTLPLVQDPAAGDYQAKFGYTRAGVPRWVIRLRTKDGRAAQPAEPLQVWYCDLNTPASLREWSEFYPPHPNPRPPPRAIGFSSVSVAKREPGRWSLSDSPVAMAPGQSVPEVLLTAPDGTTYTNVSPYFAILAPLW